METRTFEIAYISGGFAIIGVLLGCLVGYYFSKHTMRQSHQNAIDLIKRQEFIYAANKLRAAFLPIIEVLNPAEFALKEDLAYFLGDRFNDTRRAVIEFSYFLDAETRPAFCKAWHEYYRYPGYNDHGIITPSFGQYLCDSESIQRKNEMKQLVHARINKILEFTKYN